MSDRKKQGLETALRHQILEDQFLAKKKSVVEEQDDWMITYADAITLILAFFVLIFAVSEINQKQFEAVNQSLNNSLLQKKDEPTVNPLTDLQVLLSSTVSEYDINPQESIKLNENSLKVALPGELLFASGSTEINPKSQQLLIEIAQKIKAFPLPNYAVEIEGHTDDEPIETLRFPSNWELSSARAIAVLKVFMQVGVEQHKLKSIGYADTQPLAPNRDLQDKAILENQKLNRRVEIKLSKVYGFEQ